MVKQRTPYGASLEDASSGDSVDHFVGGVRPDEAATEAPAQPGPDWMQLAHDAFEDSDRFLESSLRWRWERNEAMYQSKHPPGSKYLSDAFKHRSKLFRPKTRAKIRQGEAHTARAYFSNEDILSVRPTDERSKEQAASAAISKHLLQYRLTTQNRRFGMPWFVTVVGAYQNAQKYGFVVSKQWWEYRERRYKERVAVQDEQGQVVYDEAGEPAFTESEQVEVLKDRPMCTLLAPENLRIDRGADWTDPINSSPFVILMQPMYIHEIEANMRHVDPKTGMPQWRKVDRAQLKKAGYKNIWDSTRIRREGNREDSTESEIAIDEYYMVWVHENFVRWEDVDYVYYTAGTYVMLSDPKPVSEVYRHCRNGERPITMGSVYIEANKNYPAGVPELGEGLQREANEIVNLRLDNVKLAMNKRYLVKRGKVADLRSMVRNVPGSVTLVSDPTEDVKVIETRDVTSSAYAEQDRINADYDEIAGLHSSGSIATNRRMNETVGGMEMLKGDSDDIAELDMRVFTETWAEPALAQICRMEQTYETDVTLLGVAGDSARLYQRYGITEINDQLLEQDLSVRINVGIGATSPTERISKVAIAAETIEKIFGEDLRPFLNAQEILNEIFAPLGYRDGSRFFTFPEDQEPAVAIMSQKMEEMQKELDDKRGEQDAKIEVAKLGALSRVLQQHLENEGNIQVETIRGEQSYEQDLLETASREFIERVRQVGGMDIEMKRGQNAVRQAQIRGNSGGSSGASA